MLFLTWRPIFICTIVLVLHSFLHFDLDVKLYFYFQQEVFIQCKCLYFSLRKKMRLLVYCFHRRTYSPCLFVFLFFWKNVNWLYKSPACLFVSPLPYMKMCLSRVIKWCCLMPWEKIHSLPASYLNCFSALRGWTGAFRLEKAAHLSCNVVVPPADEVVAPHSSGLIISCHGWLEHWLLCAWDCFSDSSFLPEMEQHSVKIGINHDSLEGWLYQETSRRSSSEVAPPASCQSERWLLNSRCRWTKCRFQEKEQNLSQTFWLQRHGSDVSNGQKRTSRSSL